MSSQPLEISWSIDWEPRNHMVFPVIRTEREPGIPRTLVVGGCQRAAYNKVYKKVCYKVIRTISKHYHTSLS